MLRVLIADDHAIVRKGLREILRDAPESFDVGEARDGGEAIALALGNDWDVVLLDITMPVANGIQVLKTLHREKPKLPVVMLSMHAAPVYIKGALHAGASGYVNKEAAPDELLTALRSAIAGEKYISHKLLASMEENQ